MIIKDLEILFNVKKLMDIYNINVKMDVKKNCLNCQYFTIENKRCNRYHFNLLTIKNAKMICCKDDFLFFYEVIVKVKII